MKIADLEFKRVGCCGEYLNAQVALASGELAVVTDHEDGTYTVCLTINGVLVGGGIKRILDVAAVESLLSSEMNFPTLQSP